MSEANLQPSWPFYQLHNMYCLHKSSEVCTQFQEKIAIHFATLGAIYIGHTSMRHVHNLMKSQLYTYLSSEEGLVLPLSVAEFGGLCTQFKDKQLCTLVA